MRKHDYSERIHGGLIKKAQHRWRCPPRYVLTQGSLHYRLATLGYQKQNPDGVRQFANILCAALPFERDEIKKAQRRRNYASISMSESIIANVATIQRRRYYVDVSMNISTIMNILTTQRRRCCSFDSPGLARNEPTLGKHSQEVSTP